MENLQSIFGIHIFQWLIFISQQLHREKISHTGRFLILTPVGNNILASWGKRPQTGSCGQKNLCFGLFISLQNVALSKDRTENTNITVQVIPFPSWSLGWELSWFIFVFALVLFCLGLVWCGFWFVCFSYDWLAFSFVFCLFGLCFGFVLLFLFSLCFLCLRFSNTCLAHQVNELLMNWSEKCRWYNINHASPRQCLILNCIFPFAEIVPLSSGLLNFLITSKVPHERLGRVSSWARGGAVG